MPDPQSPLPGASRQKARRTLTILAVLLVAIGFLVLFVLQRIPLPLRILIGLGDLFAGLVLLVLIRQKFGNNPPGSR